MAEFVWARVHGRTGRRTGPLWRFHARLELLGRITWTQVLLTEVGADAGWAKLFGKMDKETACSIM